MKLRSWSTRSRRASRSSSAAGAERQLAGAVAGERERDRVDGEVPPLEVLGERRRLHVGQRARVGVRLAPGAGDVVAEPVERRRSRSRTGRAPSARRRAIAANAAASPSTTRSRSIGAPPSSRSRTAPPTRYTPARPAGAQQRPRRRQRADALEQLGKKRRHSHSFFPSAPMAGAGRRVRRKVPARRWLACRAMPSPGSRRWLRWGLVAVAVVLIAAGGAVAFVLLHSPHNVSHPERRVHDDADHDHDRGRATQEEGRRSTTSCGRGTATTPGARASSPGTTSPSRRCASAGASRTTRCSSSRR